MKKCMVQTCQPRAFQQEIGQSGMRLEKLALHPLPTEAVLCFNALLHVLSPHVTHVDMGLPISEPAETPKENRVPGWRKCCMC